MKNLKPVIFLEGEKMHYRENQYAQNLLLKALSQGITDVNELKKILGFKTVTEVYCTLDKMKIRKGYHDALTKAGLSLDFIVDNLKKLCEGDTKDKIKLGALQTILKSLGLDKYVKEEDAGKNWEELVLEIIDKKEKGKISEEETTDDIDYEVAAPSLPEEVKKRQAEEKKIAEELYD